MHASTNIHAFATGDEIHLHDRFNHNMPHEFVTVVVNRNGRTEQQIVKTYPTRVAAYGKMYESMIEEMDMESEIDMRWHDGQITMTYPDGHRVIHFIAAI